MQLSKGRSCRSGILHPDRDNALLRFTEDHEVLRSDLSTIELMAIVVAEYEWARWPIDTPPTGLQR